MHVATLLDALTARGLTPATVAMDMGYDHNRIHAECAERDCAANWRGLSLTPAVRLVTASRICSSSAWSLENAVLGPASAAGVNSVPQTAHVAFCGKYDVRPALRRWCNQVDLIRT